MSMRPVFLFAIATAMPGSVAVPALAQDTPGPNAPREATLDIDHDGKTDRAALVENGTGSYDLHIYLADGDGEPGLSGKPTFLKADIAAGAATMIEGRGNGSLIVSYGCGGCSNDYGTALTIVHRDGAFLVVGYTLDWETRERVGRCDINLLTRQVFVTEGLDSEVSKRFKGKSGPVKLADWSEETQPGECDF